MLTTAFISVNAGENLNTFESSLILRGKLVQSEMGYCYDSGNIGSLLVMNDSVEYNGSSSDEASGGPEPEKKLGNELLIF